MDNPTIYTIKNEPPDFVAYVLAHNWDEPTELCRGGVAKDVVKAAEELYRGHGALERVSRRVFQEAIEDRTYHSDEMLQYLKTHPEGDLTSFYLWGSRHRPITSFLTSCITQVDQAETGYYTYIHTYYKLSPNVVDGWELTFISGPRRNEKEVS